MSPSLPRYQYLLLLAGFLVVVGGCRQNLWPGPDAIDADAPTEFTVTSSGLRYKILRRTAGTRPKPDSKVHVHYRGWLADGTVFDSSYNKGMSMAFIVEQTIPGWVEGLQYIGEGGMIELEIPPDIAYGEKGSPPLIPGNAILSFRIELLDVEE
jgi:FKBP-type peptidyl-prolyl cis-trans isomerase FkpA